MASVSLSRQCLLREITLFRRPRTGPLNQLATSCTPYYLAHSQHITVCDSGASSYLTSEISRAHRPNIGIFNPSLPTKVGRAASRRSTWRRITTPIAYERVTLGRRLHGGAQMDFRCHPVLRGGADIQSFGCHLLRMVSCHQVFPCVSIHFIFFSLVRSSRIYLNPPEASPPRRSFFTATATVICYVHARTLLAAQAWSACLFRRVRYRRSQCLTDSRHPLAARQDPSVGGLARSCQTGLCPFALSAPCFIANLPPTPVPATCPIIPIPGCTWWHAHAEPSGGEGKMCVSHTAISIMSDVDWTKIPLELDENDEHTSTELPAERGY